MGSEKTIRLVTLHINGEPRTSVVRNSEMLLHTLREKFGLTGAKPACENGDCGACTVLIEGYPINSCQLLTVEAADQQITTIEGLRNTPIQRAFMRKGTIQCGYCTPGLIINCTSLIHSQPDADDETIREWLSSNLCRCTGYEEIMDAVKSVLEAARGE